MSAVGSQGGGEPEAGRLGPRQAAGVGQGGWEGRASPSLREKRGVFRASGSCCTQDSPASIRMSPLPWPVWISG